MTQDAASSHPPSFRVILLDWDSSDEACARSVDAAMLVIQKKGKVARLTRFDDGTGTRMVAVADRPLLSRYRCWLREQRSGGVDCGKRTVFGMEYRVPVRIPLRITINPHPFRHVTLKRGIGALTQASTNRLLGLLILTVSDSERLRGLCVRVSPPLAAKVDFDRGAAYAWHEIFRHGRAPYRRQAQLVALVYNECVSGDQIRLFDEFLEP